MTGGRQNDKKAKLHLILTYMFSYLLWVPLIFLSKNNILSFGEPIFMIPYILGGLSPAIWSIVLEKKYCTKKDYKAFLKNIVNPKQNIIWHIAVVLFAALNMGVSMLIGGFKVSMPIYMIIPLLPVMVIGGGVEEIGWRGVVQKEFEEKFTPFFGNLILGIVWTFWHLPLFFIVGVNQETSMNFGNFILTTIALAFFLAIIYDGSKSIFLCIFLHALMNSLTGVFTLNNNYTSSIVILIISIFVYISYQYIYKKSKAERQQNKIKVG